MDEISEMRLELQPKLLRVIQEQEFERVGGSQSVRVDVRIVVTTNRNLEREVGTGRFRSDLFYRLSVVPIFVPALRERREDVPLLVKHFLKRAVGRDAPDFVPVASDVLELLRGHDWPGNVRELAHAVERAVIMAGGREIRAEDFNREIVSARGKPMSSEALGIPHTTPPPSQHLPLNLEELERLAIERALDHTGGRRARAARLLGISERTLRNKLKRLTA